MSYVCRRGAYSLQPICVHVSSIAVPLSGTSVTLVFSRYGGRCSLPNSSLLSTSPSNVESVGSALVSVNDSLISVMTYPSDSPPFMAGMFLESLLEFAGWVPTRSSVVLSSTIDFKSTGSSSIVVTRVLSLSENSVFVSSISGCRFVSWLDAMSIMIDVVSTSLSNDRWKFSCEESLTVEIVYVSCSASFADGSLLRRNS